MRYDQAQNQCELSDIRMKSMRRRTTNDAYTQLFLVYPSFCKRSDERNLEAYQTVSRSIDVCLPTAGTRSDYSRRPGLTQTYAIYKDGTMSKSVKMVRRKGGNCRREARMRKITSGVVSRADWYAVDTIRCQYIYESLRYGTDVP